MICFAGSSVFASDNVLQAIQVNGVNDSYNVILKSDDVAEMQKTVQAPNKMILTLKGIRASKTINTIYNNTSSVDSVVVEPTGEDSIKISLQGENISTAKINFDSLKTPLGVLGNTAKENKPADEIVLSDPTNSYRPVYNQDNGENDGFDFAGTSSSVLKGVKNIFKDQKTSWTVTLSLFALLLVCGIKLIKSKDSDIKVGLSQGLKQREIEMYRNNAGSDLSLNREVPAAPAPTQQGIGSNYGLRAYQQGTKSPYVTSEIQRPRPTMPPKAPVAPVSANQQVNMRLQSASTNQNMAQSGHVAGPITAQRATQAVTKPKTTNIDSMKFLESMTKIYEKNGRTDLAQGLKTNMKKAKMNLR